MPFKKIFFAAVKLSLVAALFLFLAFRATQSSALSDVRFDARGLAYLGFGFILNLAATTVTIVRWRALVQALDTPLSLVDALRFGFLGFAFNLSPVGVVGGDATKVVLLAKKTSISAGLATASVVLDRFIGLYAMFVLGLGVAFASGFYANSEPLARFTTQGLIALSVAATVFTFSIVCPASGKRRRERLAGRCPLIGGPLRKATSAALLYQNRKKILGRAFVATLGVHALFAASLYCFARGLYDLTPSPIDHVVLYCSANVGSMIPLSAGPFEYFLDELYPLFTIDGNDAFATGYGATIGVVYRLATFGVAAFGVAYYLTTKPGRARRRSAAYRN